MGETTACGNCGATARRARGKYDFRDSGLPVVLEGIELVKCGKCGNTDPVIPKLSKVLRLIALAVVSKPYRLTGAEVRFLRKFLHMSGAEFAAVLKVDKTTVSKWENDAVEVGGQTDRLIRAVAVGFGKGLQGELKNVVVLFSKIGDEIKPVTIRMNAEKMSYRYAA